jgi:membrane protease YdiL (CAAX protease family)
MACFNWIMNIFKYFCEEYFFSYIYIQNNYKNNHIILGLLMGPIVSMVVSNILVECTNINSIIDCNYDSLKLSLFGVIMYIILSPLLIVSIPVNEEIMFRQNIYWYFIEKLKIINIFRLKKLLSIILSSIVFGLAHFFNIIFVGFNYSILQVCYGVILGIILSLILEFTNINVCIGIHMCNNFLAVFIPVIKYLN